MSTPEQRAKWREAARARRNAKGKALRAPKSTTHEAIVYLKHAERAMTAALRSGGIKRLGREHLLTLLALETLTGGPP